tara:strand:- start:2675 stop:2905 length:231 start_codon:yes stop_codon:yes gene_type:complete
MDDQDKNSLEVAMEALRRIENHERECSNRWSECMVELRNVKEAIQRNSNRWERLGWFIATGVGIGFIFLLLKSQLV